MPPPFLQQEQNKLRVDEYDGEDSLYSHHPTQIMVLIHATCFLDDMIEFRSNRNIICNSQINKALSDR